METEKALIQKDESLPFRLMDALDDELIIAELEGRMPEILTYHFSDKGQEIWGLSKAGVDEATGELAKQGEVIRELELNFTDGREEAYFTVKAGRYVISKDGQEILLDTKFGTKRQAKKTATGKDNTFWYEQGSIKACRNASMRLIPKTIVQAVIENAKKKGRVKEVKEEKPPLQEPQRKNGDKPKVNTMKVTTQIFNITQKDGKKTDGKPYTLYTVIGQMEGKDVEFKTFSKTVFETAQKGKGTTMLFEIEYITGKFGNDIVELKEMGPDENAQ